MTFSSGTLHSKMSLTRGRSSGWAAFDPKHRQKQGPKPELDADPFPPMTETSAADAVKNLTNHRQLTRPFSSVVRPSSDYPVLTSGSKIRTPVNNSDRKLNKQIVGESSMTTILSKLRQLHSWADDSLVEDILTAVNNDEEQASALLKAMVSSSSEESTKILPEPSCIVGSDLHNKKIELINEAISQENQPSDCTVVKLVSGHLFSLPIEPEWEEDDVYSIHRKEAIKMMRSASQHSRAANNAFSRGDHFAAQQLSLKARGEWRAAEKLNAKAAKEILRIRNEKNDVCKLDLHGLHASEAICALEEHLHRIETQMPMKRSVSSDGLDLQQRRIANSPSVECSALYMEERAREQNALSTPRHTVLQVITGTGNHSRGQAALPIAVRSFLIEKGYRFDDARPGVFAVRPKFPIGLPPKS